MLENNKIGNMVKKEKPNILLLEYLKENSEITITKKVTIKIKASLKEAFKVAIVSKVLLIAYC